jgi:putative ABC transport system permease protein
MYMWNEIRFAIRLMRRTPFFNGLVVLTVAVAITANTAIFSVVNAVILKPMPFREPARLMQVAEKNDKLNLPSFAASVLNFVAWREQTKTFEQLAAIGFSTLTLSGTGEPEQLSGNRISPALMSVVGLTPVAGRGFSPDEEKPGTTPVAMISEGLWKRRFGGDPGLIGRTIILNGAAATVVGVAPAALNLVSGADIYTPLVIDPATEIRLNHVILVFGRLRPGVSVQQAQAEMDAIAARDGEQYPDVRDWGIRLITLFDTFVTAQLKTALLVLLSAVGLVLLIACANIANLLLTRAAAREKEMAARIALGASRFQLLRQVIVESLVLSGLGGIAGILGAVWAVSVVNRVLPRNLLPLGDVHLDAAVLCFAAALTVFTGLLFGVIPAYRASRLDINEVLKTGGRGESGGVRKLLRSGLAAAEISLAAMLLIGAGLLIQSLTNLERARVGFDSSNLITFQLALPVLKYDPTNGQAFQFYRTLMDSLDALPGVRGAAVSSGIPFGAGAYNTSPFETSGPSVLPPDTAIPVDWRTVSPGYFKVMGIPLLRGREFADSDGPKAPLAVIVSRTTARRFWGDADPIGRTIHRPSDPRNFAVVGVVGDVRSTSLNQESPALYFPAPYRASPVADVVVRSSGSPESLLPVIRQKVGELDANLALANVKTMEQWISNSSAQPRLSAVVLGVFAFIALAIAAIGVYGVFAYSVSQRIREIGLRMAIGATPGSVLALIVREGMIVVLIGISIGTLGGLALGRTVSSLVYGVTVHDPGTFAAVAIVLFTVALAACAIPARRAARVDPMVALRDE